MSELLRLDGVSAGYGAVTVVRDLSLRVGEGQVVALVGPNGAGKTTTLSTIAGQVAAQRGTVELFGRPTVASTAGRVRSGLAMVTDDSQRHAGASPLDAAPGRAWRRHALESQKEQNRRNEICNVDQHHAVH